MRVIVRVIADGRWVDTMNGEDFSQRFGMRD